MKKTLEHLPESKQAEIKRIIPIITEMCNDVEMIILFGSYARGDYREEEDLQPDRKSGAVSDYDILIVCKDKYSSANHLLWRSIAKHCNGCDITVPFRFIVHDIKYIKKRLKEIHYFFSDIVKEGCLLYTTNRYALKVGKELTAEQKLEVAKEHYDNWFESSKEFFIDYNNAFNRQSYKKAAFELHQAAESSYKALLLVYTNYTPHDHYIVSMIKVVKEIFPELEEIFPVKNKADDDLLKLFDYAYIGARYDPKFSISKEDLEYLSARVKLLLKLTEKLCREKFEDLKK